MHIQSESKFNEPIVVANEGSEHGNPGEPAGNPSWKGIGQSRVALFEAEVDTQPCAPRKGRVLAKNKPPILDD